MTREKLISMVDPAGVSGNGPAQSEGETSKDPAQIVEEVAAEYVAGADEAPLGYKADGTPRKRRARKPKDVGATPGSPQAEPISGARPDAGFALDKQIVEKTVKTILTTVDGFVQRKIYKTATFLKADQELAREMATNAGLTVSEADLMSELTGVVFEKYGLLTGYAPELLLGVVLGEYALRVSLVIKRLNELEGMKRAKVVKVETVDEEKG